MWQHFRIMGFSAETRRTILERDQGCVVARLIADNCCDGVLHVHHIIPVRERPDLADDPTNGVVVCRRHHPTLESIRRVLAKQRTCTHKHVSREAREACERKLNAV